MLINFIMPYYENLHLFWLAFIMSLYQFNTKSLNIIIFFIPEKVLTFLNFNVAKIFFFCQSDITKNKNKKRGNARKSILLPTVQTSELLFMKISQNFIF